MTIDNSENIKMLNSFISKIQRLFQPQHKNRTGLQYLWNIKKKSITASEIFDLKRRLQRQPGSELAWPSTIIILPTFKRTKDHLHLETSLKRWKLHFDKSDTYHYNPVKQSSTTTPKTERHERGHVVTAGLESSLLNWHLNERTPERPRRMII